MKTGVELISDERQRQIDVEKFDVHNDDEYYDQELADAAICYLVDPQQRDTEPFPWPWDEQWWKPCPDDRVRELVKAGALVAAEIDRLLRKQQNQEK